jgi:hypothetical protein
MKMSGSVTAYPIVTQPKSQEFLTEIFLDHQIVSLSAEFILKMIGPDEFTLVVQDHWPGVGDLPSFRGDEVEVILCRAFGAPLQVIELGHFQLGGVEVLCWVGTGRASVESTIVCRLKDGFQWNLFFLSQA